MPAFSHEVIELLDIGIGKWLKLPSTRLQAAGRPHDGLDWEKLGGLLDIGIGKWLELPSTRERAAKRPHDGLGETWRSVLQT